MGRTLTAGLLLLGLLLARPASPAPIELLLLLDPGQSGPVYSWSLLISVEEGYDVGAVDLLTAGFESFAVNAANPGISVLDTAFNPDLSPFYPGKQGVVINNTENGVAIAAGGSTHVLLGTFFGPATTSPPVGLFDGEEAFGGTVYDMFLRTRPPGEASLSAYPLASLSFAAIGAPEPSGSALCAAALSALAGLRALRTARRRDA